MLHGVSVGSLGYWGHQLETYDQAAVWERRSKSADLLYAGDREYWTGYEGPISAASGAVAANYVTVHMFAAVASGQATPEEAAAERSGKQSGPKG